jgi:hypothetical protein
MGNTAAFGRREGRGYSGDPLPCPFPVGWERVRDIVVGVTHGGARSSLAMGWYAGRFQRVVGSLRQVLDCHPRPEGQLAKACTVHFH